MTSANPNPIYQQMLDALHELIALEDYSEGDKFLTEREVAERFGVSRATANKALASLVAEGVLEFRKGVGTFVRGKLLNYELASLVSFTDKARQAGLTPTTEVLEFRDVSGLDIPADVAAALRIRGEQALYYMERLRLVDGEPIILEYRWVVEQYCPGLCKYDIDGSLYELFTDRFGLHVTGAEQTIRAIRLSERDGLRLGVSTGVALEVRAIGEIDNGVPLWSERTLYRGEFYEFHNRLGGLRIARPAVGALRRPS
jgi:DNA-binding GntR family transcriptional regulator